MSEWISAEECTPWGDELVVAAVRYADRTTIALAWHGDECWSGGWHIVEQDVDDINHFAWSEESEFAGRAVVTHWMPLPELPEEEE